MKNIFRATQYLLSQPGGRKRFATYWLVVFVLIITIPNIGYMLEVLLNLPILSVGEKISYLLSPYLNTLGASLEPVTLSLLVLTLALALNFLFIRYIRTHQQSAKGGLGSALVMFVSSHCVACGGSLLAPVVSFIAGSGGAYFSAERYERIQLMTIGLNVLATIIAVLSIRKASRTVNLMARQHIPATNPIRSSYHG